MPTIHSKIEGNMSKKEVEDILKEYLESIGYHECIIQFNITMETDKNDYFTEHPSRPVFNGLSFSCTDNIKNDHENKLYESKMETCSYCNGDGYNYEALDSTHDCHYYKKTCNKCNGSGKIIDYGF